MSKPKGNPMLPTEYDHSVKQANQFEAIHPPAGVHPRLYIREADLPDLHSRATKPNGPGKYYQQILSTIACGKYDSGILENPTDRVRFTHMAPRHIIQDILDTAKGRAILYVMDREDNLAHGQQAVATAKEFMRTYECTWSGDGYTIGNNACLLIHSFSCIYDWCFDILTTEDKQFFIQKFDYYLSYLEFSRTEDGEYTGWEHGFTGTDSMNGHHVEHQIAAVTALGIALYDEKPYYWQVISDYMYNHMFPTSNFLLQQGTVWQGTSYGPGRLQHFAHSNLLLYKMQEPGNRKSFLTPDAIYALYSMIYYRRPDNQTVRIGDIFNSSTPFGVEWVFGEGNCILYLNAIYHDPYLQTELIRLEKVRKLQTPLAFLLWDSVEPKAHAGNLPTAYYMPYPNGEILATTGWPKHEKADFNSNIMHVDMRLGAVQPFNHEHADSGSFQIYYRGGLVVDGGIYEGHNGFFGSAHDINWDKKTISHNCFLIYDPHYDKKFDLTATPDWTNPNPEEFIWRDRRVANDGGQLYSFGFGRAKDAPLDVYYENGTAKYFPGNNPKRGVELHGPDSNWHTGKILSHFIEPGILAPKYTYLKGDLAQLYGYRAKEAHRSFMFLNFEDAIYPGALIVFDRITTGDKYPDYLDYEKYFLLHSMNAPDIIRDHYGKIDGFLIKRTEEAKNGDVTVGKYNGQLLCTPLLPTEDNISLKVVNGFNIFGEEFPNNPINKHLTEEAGEWMLMVSPKAKSQTDMMLNVMQVSDAGTETLPVTMVGRETDDMVGAKIFGRIAMFSTSGKLRDTAITIPSAGDEAELKYHIADLAPGKWMVTGLNGNVAEFTVEEDSNIGVFTASPSYEYVVSPA